MAAKRVLLIVALAYMGAAGYVLAASSTVEATPSCAPGNLDTYIALGSTGCTIDDKTFSNFRYQNDTSGSAVAVPSSGVIVAPIPTPGNPGFTFTGPFAAVGQPSSVLQESLGSVFFDVNTNSGAALIKDASLGSVQGGQGSFVSSAIEEICFIIPFSSSCFGGSDEVVLIVDNSGDCCNSATFTPRSGVSVDSRFIPQATGAGNSAFVSSITVQFSEVPEPGTMALFGTGLLGLAGRNLRRRR